MYCNNLSHVYIYSHHRMSSHLRGLTEAFQFFPLLPHFPALVLLKSLLHIATYLPSI